MKITIIIAAASKPQFLVNGSNNSNATAISITGISHERRFAFVPIKGDFDRIARKVFCSISLLVAVYTKRRMSKKVIISINQLFKETFFIVQL